MRSILTRLTLVSIPLILATPALASDGVLEINQTCAVQTGCFSGDTAGLPVTISTSGSYRLTSNLIVPNQNTDGIQISTDNVSIDLAGFEIRGPVVCSGSPITCVPASGTGSGVQGVLATESGISVSNGSIRGMGRNGVALGIQAEVTNIRARSNRVIGINTNTASIISGNTTYQNGHVGIFTSGGSIVSGNTAYQNGGSGILATSGSIISGNTALANAGDGIFASDASTVQRNAVSFNGGYGLNLIFSNAAYRENVITNNTAGTVNGGVDAGANVTNGVVTPTP